MVERATYQGQQYVRLLIGWTGLRPAYLDADTAARSRPT